MKWHCVIVNPYSSSVAHLFNIGIWYL